MTICIIVLLYDIKGLRQHSKIPYKIRTINYNGSHRRGSLGINPDWMYEYHIYVHKDDYEKAKTVISNFC